MTLKLLKAAKTKPILVSLLCGIVAAGLYWLSASGVLTHGTSFDALYAADVQLTDALTQKPSVVNPNIYVIGIDEDSLRELGAWNDWDRDIMAQMIQVLNADPNARPAVIGIDVSYFSETDPVHDKALADAAAQAGNVVMAAEVIYADSVQYDEQGKPFVKKMTVSAIDYPYQALRSVTSQGIINTLAEKDGVIRNSIHKAEHQGETIYSFGDTIYREYAKKHNLPLDTQPPLDPLNRYRIPFTGLPGDYFGGSFVQVLNGNISPRLFADAIVLIGPYAPGMMDQYYTPIDSGRMMYGVEIHANIIDSLLSQNFKQTVPIWVQAVVLFLITILAYWLFYLVEPKMSAVILLVMIVGYLYSVTLCYSLGWIISAIYLPIVVTLLYLYRLVYRYFTEKAKRQIAVNTFKRYLEPQVVEHLLRDDMAKQHMDSVKRDVAILFADIRGFTPMSESLQTSQVVGILNEYLSLASSAIFQQQGTVDKFIGDSVMAIFNAPLDLDDYTFRAVAAALDIAQGTKAMQAQLQERFGRTIHIGIGIHCGEAIVGNIGANFRMDYTAIGDTVNTAARLENMAQAGQILASAAVYERVKNRVQASRLGQFTLKGKANQVEVYLIEKILDQPNVPKKGEQSC